MGVLSGLGRVWKRGGDRSTTAFVTPPKQNRATAPRLCAGMTIRAAPTSRARSQMASATASWEGSGTWSMATW